jgi:hypothetical protein
MGAGAAPKSAVSTDRLTQLDLFAAPGQSLSSNAIHKLNPVVERVSDRACGDFRRDQSTSREGACSGRDSSYDNW